VGVRKGSKGWEKGCKGVRKAGVSGCNQMN